MVSLSVGAEVSTDDGAKGPISREGESEGKQKDRFKGGECQGGHEEEPDEHGEEDRHEDEEEKGWHMVHHGEWDEIVHAETRDSEKKS